MQKPYECSAMASKIDFFNTPFVNFIRYIYIPERCPFEVTGSTNGATTTLTTKEPHCLSTGDTVVLCLSHGDGCNIISYSQEYNATVIDETNFSIPYDSASCTRPLTGKGHQPKDLTGLTFNANLHKTESNYFGGTGASGTAGSQVVKIPRSRSENATIEVGQTITIANAEYSVLGNSLSAGKGHCDGQIINTVILAQPLSADLDNADWFVTTPGTRKGALVQSINVNKVDATGALELTFAIAGLNQLESYTYDLFETIGAVENLEYYGSITFGEPQSEDCGAVGACSVPYPVLIADPELVTNVPITVAHLTALENLNASGFTTGTIRFVLGHTSAGNGVTHRYRLEGAQGRTANGESLINVTGLTGRLWVRQELKYTIEDFEGVGNGSFANDAALEAALTFLSSVGGGTLDFANRTYRFEQAHNIPSNIRLRGQGHSVTKFLLDPAATISTHWFNSTDSQNVVYEGIHFDGNSKTNNAIALIYAVTPNGLDVIRCRLTGWKYGIQVKSATGKAAQNIRIEQSIIHQPAATHVVYPIQINNTSEGPLVTGVWVIENLVQGVRGAYSSTNNKTADQITLQGCNRFWVERNQSIDGGEIGITVSRLSQNGVIRGNIVHDADGGGIDVGSAYVRINVADASGFQDGEEVWSVGQLSGADGISGSQVKGIIDHLDATTNQIWLRSINALFDLGDGNLVGQTSGASTTANSYKYTSNIVVEGNICYLNGYDVDAIDVDSFGLHIQYCSDILITDNKCYDPTGTYQKYGILLRQARNITMGINDATRNALANVQQTGTVDFTIQNNFSTQIFSAGVRFPRSTNQRLSTVTDTDGSHRGLALSGVEYTYLVIDAGYTTDGNAASGVRASDNLERIIGGQSGSVVFLQCAANARPITIVHGTNGDGGFRNSGGANLVLDDTNKVYPFIYDPTVSKWKHLR